jgi:hypothetical protein
VQSLISAEHIFKDVGVIYGLRSTLVHGGAMSEKSLLKEVRKISTVPAGLPDRKAVAHAVERLRDLVRRSLLARICLATGDTPLWPLDADIGVDAAMVNDLRRKSLREAWRGTLSEIDAVASANASIARVGVHSGWQELPVPNGRPQGCP